jgi:hypothetical protein
MQGNAGLFRFAIFDKKQEKSGIFWVGC